jgi:ketosteroid isomerase-like protein
MTEQTSTDVTAIRTIAREINRRWRDGEYDRMTELLHNDAVIAPPGFAGRVAGRDAFIQSYRDFDRAAATLAFSADEAQVDVVGDTGVAVIPFTVVYELQGVRLHEQGHEILTLSRTQGTWKVVWRTVQMTTPEKYNRAGKRHIYPAAGTPPTIYRHINHGAITP